MIDRAVLLSPFLLTIVLAAPSILPEILGLGGSKEALGKTLLISCIGIPVLLARLKLNQTALIQAMVLALYTSMLCLALVIQGLGTSVSPILGAGLKCSIFFLSIPVFHQIRDLLNIGIIKFFYCLLILGAVSTFIHNIVSLPEVGRIVVDERPMSILVGSLSASRLYFDDFRFYRLSSIFYEPSNYGLILYLILIYTGRIGVRSIRFTSLLIINLISTFSLGLFVSLAVYCLQYLKLSAIKIPRRLTSAVVYSGVVCLLSALAYLLWPALTFVYARLGIGREFLAGDNRFYDDLLPQNIWLGEGSYGGGFDSIVSVFYQYGVLGTAVLCLPFLLVAWRLMRSGDVCASIGLLLFLLHKPNILTPVIMFLTALIYLCTASSKPSTSAAAS